MEKQYYQDPQRSRQSKQYRSKQYRTRQKRLRRRRRIRRFGLIVALLLLVLFFVRPVLKSRSTDLGFGREDSIHEVQGVPGSLDLNEPNEWMADNPELDKFVENYESGNYTSGKKISYTKKEKRAEIPQLMQWDERWGYDDYGSSVIGITGCAPTTMSMVIVGLTGDTTVNPRVLADYATRHGYYESGAGTTWSFFPACAEAYGLTCQELSLSKERVFAELDVGHPIICGMRPGHFTTSGHFILLVGVEDGKIQIHDPNNRINCETAWEYETLADEIKVLWTFSK